MAAASPLYLLPAPLVHQRGLWLRSSLVPQILDDHIYFEVSHGPTDVASMRLARTRVTDGAWRHLLVELRSAKEGKDVTYLAVVTLDYGMEQVSPVCAWSPGPPEAGAAGRT